MAMRVFWLGLALAWPAAGRAVESYGAKGLYPVYAVSGQWLIFDRAYKAGAASPLAEGARLLVVGSRGSEVFTVARRSSAPGAACRSGQPVRLRTALLKGPRQAVGVPIIGIKVKPGFTLQGSRARFLNLGNQVDESAYARLADPVKAAVVSELKDGSFRFAVDGSTNAFLKPDLGPEDVQMKLDFGAAVTVQGLESAFVFVEGSQFSSAFRRCLRLEGAGGKLAGGCAAMPDKLMAETGLLSFVAYDPGGDGRPLLLAYTPQAPLWGEERWGFSLRDSGPRLVLFDALDPRCREGF